MVYLDIFVCLGAFCYPASRELECTLVFGDHDRTIRRFFRCGVDNLNFLSANLVNNGLLRDELIQSVR